MSAQELQRDRVSLIARSRIPGSSVSSTGDPVAAGSAHCVKLLVFSFDL
jgi:hypothetical protein